MYGLDPQRNNLDLTASPYLKQHKDNPVWWQPWTQSAIDFAAHTHRPLFVSVGYATCHWCHVMASETFSDNAIADHLNRNFVSIKVDREERPDIDHFLMQFLLASRGQGGWPLNAFLTPDLRPFLALTYLPAYPRNGTPGFSEILDRVAEYYNDQSTRVPVFDFWIEERKDPPRRNLIARDALHCAHNLVRRTDRQYGGFGTGTKFPPHSSLLYLLHVHALYGDEVVERTLHVTLNSIARRGLHDHLQGGFFRYCVDRAWTIPHFEKMLYDQAMSLWVYSLAWKVLRDAWYRDVADGIVQALDESFIGASGLFYSAHDADTDHEEGTTYLWSDAEIEALDPTDRNLFLELFEIVPGGNFEGRHHLVRRDDGPLDAQARAFLRKLLDIRRTRRQPESDNKVVTAWNALAGIALVHAGRYLERPELIERARSLLLELEKRNRLSDGRWIRSSLDGHANETECLEDYGAVLFLATLLAEHAPNAESFSRWVHWIEEVEKRLTAFRTERGWMYTIADDFSPVPADTFDSPTPSPTALAEGGLVRSALLRGVAGPSISSFGSDFQEDFHNLVVLLSEGEFYVLETSELKAWESLPPNTIQRVAEHETWCFRDACRPGMPPEWNPVPDTL